MNEKKTTKISGSVTGKRYLQIDKWQKFQFAPGPVGGFYSDVAIFTT